MSRARLIGEKELVLRRVLMRSSRVTLVLIALMTVFILPSSTRAQPSDTEALFRSMRELYQSGKYAEALPVAKRYAEAIKSRYGTEVKQYAVALTWLAHVYRAQGRQSDAEPLYKRALAIDEKALGPEHADVGTALNNLALVYHDERRYAEAELLYQRALTIRENALGPDHPALVPLFNNLALLYRAQRRYTDAEPLFRRALAINEKALGSEHADGHRTQRSCAELL
jgi:tetratricopeptide (TPR) repeat protein